MNGNMGCCFNIDFIMVNKLEKKTNLSLTARPSTDSIEVLPFSSFFEGFVEDVESEKQYSSNRCIVKNTSC